MKVVCLMLYWNNIFLIFYKSEIVVVCINVWVFKKKLLYLVILLFVDISFFEL